MIASTNTKRILIYLAFAFGIPWVAALVITLTGQTGYNPARAGALANYFFILTPWLANIAARLLTKEGWGNLWLRPNFRHGWRYYLALALLPLMAVIVGSAIFYLIFPQSFDPALGAVQKLVGSALSAVPLNPWLILGSITISMLILTVPLNAVVSMGEEFGWRGYLLPKLAVRFGGTDSPVEGTAQEPTEDPKPAAGLFTPSARKAALLTGLIHGVWHWPLLFMTMSITPGATPLTAVVYLLLTCSMSVLLSWGTLRGGSVWSAAVGHGAVNAFAVLPMLLLKGLPIPLLGPDPTGLIGVLGYLVIAVLLLAPWTKDQRERAAE